MNALDFKYDGTYLSDFGCIICTFDNANPEEISIGSQIIFNTISVGHGKKFMNASSQYDTCIETELEICKDPDAICDIEDKYFSLEEQRAITRWLNRNSFLKFTLIDDGYENIYFEASFNVQKIELAGKVIGMKLSVVTNRPFALCEPITHRFNITTENGVYTIYDESDEIGFLYVDVEIKCNQDGDLIITNELEHKTTEIYNCKKGEVITIKNMIIESSSDAHSANNIMNDFNFNFPHIINTFNDRRNKFTFSIPCSVTLTYNPVRKVGV